MKLKCIVVDDEPIARKGLLEYIHSIDSLEAVGECRDASEATVSLQGNAVDLVFLDIQMPKVTGLDWLRSLDNPPMVIITTAFTEYAYEGFELDVIDYLVKPIPFQRFAKAVDKAVDYYKFRNGDSEAKEPYIFVKSAGKFERLYLDDILFIEAMQNYVIINVKGGKHIVYLTLTGLESELPVQQFMRVHKSYIVAIDKVKGIQDHQLLIESSAIPVSRSLRDQVSNRIMGNSLLKRK